MLGGGAVGNMIASLKFNRLQKSQRRSMYDADGNTNQSGYGALNYDKSMRTYEFAALQKKMFREKKQRRRRFLIVYGLFTLLLVGTVFYFIFFY